MNEEMAASTSKAMSSTQCATTPSPHALHNTPMKLLFVRVALCRSSPLQTRATVISAGLLEPELARPRRAAVPSVHIAMLTRLTRMEAKTPSARSGAMAVSGREPSRPKSLDIRRPIQGRFVLGAASPCISWTRSPRAPRTVARPQGPEHAS